MSKKLNIIHVVKRYGPVGGMERYVWELTRGLQQLGHQVTVLCERCHADAPRGVQVVELGETAKRPRWLSQVRFSWRVTNWVREHPVVSRVIHSHERLGVHDLTTFHGPPFATIYEKGWWRFVSIRVWVRLYLERRELATAQVIVPNSAFISRQLAHYYPAMTEKLSAPIAPGILPIRQRAQRSVPVDGGIVGFVGWEWQRKGLAQAIDIVAALRRTRPNLELWVVGPVPAELGHLFAGWEGGYRLLGWREDNDYFSGVDVLLHPARAEPYGMVISEAMAARVPVVISDVCGAAEHVTIDAGAVLPLDAAIELWATAVEKQLTRTQPVPRFDRSWSKVAQEYEMIYGEILKAE
ncbi:MAG: glycosyl transferase family 1 [Gallionellales bacterium RIFOXYB12_FULL_54_9]|nr:MAG: glycosyl transferase family 1 [Gallionellales bacterium RIFOXYB12_FULL_54_9]